MNSLLMCPYCGHMWVKMPVVPPSQELCPSCDGVYYMKEITRLEDDGCPHFGETSHEFE